MHMTTIQGLLALALTPLLTCQQPITATGTVKVADMSKREALPPVMPITEVVTLKANAEGVPTWAECTDPSGGTCEINKKKVAVIVGKSKADLDKPDLIGVDLNADGKIEKGEQMALAVTARKRGESTMLTSEPVDCAFDIGGTKLAAKASYTSAGNTSRVALQFPSYLEATVKIDNVEQTIAIVDKDMDGKFGTTGDLWTVHKLDEKRPATEYSLSGIGEHFFDKDHLVGITVKDNVVNVVSTPAKAPNEKDAEAQRERVEKIWTARFDLDRADFYKARGIDESRPLAKTPIHWNYVSFDEGLALAKKANKPLFVDVMAFWCVWCYRMDYTTYPDQEVADLLNNSFVPVKIIQEQDLVGDYKRVMEGKLEAKGIPAMGIFDAAGNKLHTIGGWNKPEDFVKELHTGLDAAAKNQSGK